jgi:hypothetical protein
MPGQRITGDTQVVAAAKAGFSERTARRLGSDPVMPSQRAVKPKRRTRAAPLEAVWDEEIVPMLRRRYGDIRDCMPHPFAGNRRIGLPSDDTQLAFCTLEQIIVGGFDPDDFARRFSERRIFGIGQSV